MPVQNMIMLTRAKKLCQCSTWSSSALGSREHGHTSTAGVVIHHGQWDSTHREWFSPRATAMRQIPCDVSMSPLWTAWRSCSCSPSTGGMSFRRVFTYLQAQPDQCQVLSVPEASTLPDNSESSQPQSCIVELDTSMRLYCSMTSSSNWWHGWENTSS